jgi:energy-coupling factor transport system ATP-binding protein
LVGRSRRLDTVEHPISTLARHVGMVFEDPETQLTAISVEHEVAFALENLCVPREEIRARILRALAAVRLEGMENKHPTNFPAGETAARDCVRTGCAAGVAGAG